MRRLSITLTLSTLFLVSICSAQQTSTRAVPNLIGYGGMLKDAKGIALSGTTAGVTFAIYKQQEGGAPVWLETQNVTPDASGRYSVLLGSTTATGLPSDLFSQQEQRWLGIQVQGQPEQPRVLLVSVPYAINAHDAETLGGLPASAFVKAETTNPSGSESAGANNGTSVNALSTAGNAGGKNAMGITALGYSPCGQPTFAGSPNVIAVWDSTGCNLTNSPLVNAAQGYQIGGSSVISIGSPADNNLFLGVGAGLHDATGSGIQNTFSGVAAGLSNTTGEQNTFSGYQAGYSNTSGRLNSFYGTGAGRYNTNGLANTFSGAAAGYNNTSGYYNTFSGYSAGRSNTTGHRNIFLGFEAGYSNTSGYFNTFSGYQAGYSNTSGYYNTFSGDRAGYRNTTGSINTFYGNGAGGNNTTGSSDIYLGNAGPATGTESNAIRIGTQGGGAGQQNTAYMAGIYGNSPSGALAVVVNASGQLGTTTSGFGVTSFNGRKGAVVPATNDYSFAQISGTVSAAQVPTNLTTYIQNGTRLQGGTNFNISGSGVAGGTFSATSYLIGLNSVLSIGPGAARHNLFIGVGAGSSAAIGPSGVDDYNAFSGAYAGYHNTSASYNTFSGAYAGYDNTTGELQYLLRRLRWLPQHLRFLQHLLRRLRWLRQHHGFREHILGCLGWLQQHQRNR